MLSVRGLTKIYAGRQVVRDVAFDLLPGTVTAVLGREGAGRTTLLRMVCGLTPPTSGEITVGGAAFAEWPNPAHLAGVVLDPDVLHPGRTGRAQLRLAARLAGLPERRIGDVTDMLGLEAHIDRRVRSYDRVLRLWLHLAHALLPDPPVLLLDEPLRALNTDDADTVRTLLRTHAGRGGTVLLTSDDLSAVDRTADRVVVVDGGRVLADGPVPVTTLTGTVTCQVRGSDNTALADALSRAGARFRPESEGYLAVRLPAPRVTEVAHAADVRITDLREGERTLDEVLADLSVES